MIKPLAHRPLSVIGAPSSAGAYGPGQELAPSTFRRHGLVDALRDAGLDVTDRGDCQLVGWKPDTANPTAANAGLVGDVASELAAALAGVFAADHDVSSVDLDFITDEQRTDRLGDRDATLDPAGHVWSHPPDGIPFHRSVASAEAQARPAVGD